MEAIVVYTAVTAAVAIMMAGILSSTPALGRRHGDRHILAGGPGLSLSRAVPLIEPGPRSRLKTGHTVSSRTLATVVRAPRVAPEPAMDPESTEAFLDSISEEVKHLREELDSLKDELGTLLEYASRQDAIPAESHDSFVRQTETAMSPGRKRGNRRRGLSSPSHA